MCQDRRGQQDAPSRRLPLSERVRRKWPRGPHAGAVHPECSSGLPGAAWGLPSLPLTQAATHPHPVAPEPVHSSAPGVLWTRNPSLLRQGTTDR